MKPSHDSPQSQQLGLNLTQNEEPDALGAIKQGFEHEIDDLVKLELTAEEMLGDEVRLAREYISADASDFWQDFKQGLISWETATGYFLLSAADPTLVEWQVNQWWVGDQSQIH